ncbi:hypothetical protein D3C84_1060490 [compost metagenome]
MQGALPGRGDDQGCHQMGGYDAAQLPLDVVATQPEQRQHYPRHHQQQPEGAQEMEGRQIDRHDSSSIREGGARLPSRAARRWHTSSNSRLAPNGHQNRSRLGWWLKVFTLWGVSSSRAA